MFLEIQYKYIECVYVVKQQLRHLVDVSHVKHVAVKWTEFPAESYTVFQYNAIYL